MSTATDKETDVAPDAPTTVRIASADIIRLDEIRKATGLTRNGLIGLAISAFIDHVKRTGKLPAPNLKKGKRGDGNASGR